MHRVDSEAWESWDSQVQSPEPACKLPLIELMVTAELFTQNFSTSVTVLIDTGCRLFVLYRKGVIPEEYIRTPNRPINICTADNSPMDGGKYGCVMTLSLPILNCQNPLYTKPFWGH
jgi:hypothetical protein